MSDPRFSVALVPTESDQDEDVMCSDCGNDVECDESDFDEPLCYGCWQDAQREYNALTAEWRAMQGGR